MAFDCSFPAQSPAAFALAQLSSRVHKELEVGLAGLALIGEIAVSNRRRGNNGAKGSRVADGGNAVLCKDLAQLITLHKRGCRRQTRKVRRVGKNELPVIGDFGRKYLHRIRDVGIIEKAEKVEREGMFCLVRPVENASRLGDAYREVPAA